MTKRTFILIFRFLFIFAPFIFVVSSATALTLLYSGEEHGQLGLHGCGAEQVGGLAHRHTLIDDLRIKHGEVLNLHTGNLIDASDPNAEWVYQIGLSALDAMAVDVLCLGPNELSLPLETLTAFHLNHPEVGFVCANATPRIDTPYLIRTISSVNVAIVGLVSKSHAPELTTVNLTQPQTALAELEAEILSKSDAVVVVFHSTQEEAQVLVKTVPWIDVLIVAGEEQKDPAMPRKAAAFIGETAIVTNAAEGAAVGVLEREHDAGAQRYIFTNEYHSVSEKITPDTGPRPPTGSISDLDSWYGDSI